MNLLFSSHIEGKIKKTIASTIKKIVYANISIILMISTSMSYKLLDLISRKSALNGAGWSRIREIIIQCLKNNKHAFNVKSFEAYLFTPVTGKDDHASGFLLKKIRENTISKTSTIKGLALGSDIQMEPYEIGSYKFENAIVTQGSDIVRLDGFCYWHKKRSILYSKLNPEDLDFLYEVDGHIAVIKPVFTDIHVECGISLLGVHDDHWGHFLVQYFPRLQVLKQHVRDEQEVMVLVPDALDDQCTEMIKMCLSESWTVCLVPSQTSVYCKKLYYTDPTAWISECDDFPQLEDYVLPQLSAEFVKSNVRSLQRKYLHQDATKQSKRRIYLRRVGRRSVVNIKEIDEVFAEFGFEIIYAHESSLKEKINMFWNAEIITGPFSSGFINCIFCKKGTKMLCLSHLGWSWELLTPSLASFFDVEAYVLTGDRVKGDDSLHASFRIDPERLHSMLDELLSDESHVGGT